LRRPLVYSDVVQAGGRWRSGAWAEAQATVGVFGGGVLD
jgi:hypothetical protein